MTNREQVIQKYLPINAKPEGRGRLISWEVSAGDIVNTCEHLFQKRELSFKMMTAADERQENGGFRIFYLFGLPQSNCFLAPYIRLKETLNFPSIAQVIHGASIHERKIKTFFGLAPIGHLNPQSIILHENWPANMFPLRKDFDFRTRPHEANVPYHFPKVEGEGIYEIPVGPVHAGIIEPGHFRFSVAGEEIILLSPRLGYVHKGSEKLFEILPLAKKLKLSERISGDSSFSHSLAFCQAAELLSDAEVPERAKYLRVIYAELERIANHFGDLGFMMLDTGFSFGGSNGGRLREMMMQWCEKLSGSRFLRGVNTFGGVTKNIFIDEAKKLVEDLKKIKKDFCEVIEIAQESNSVLNRLKDTGKLDLQIAKDHCAVGVPARALGVSDDTRIDYPYEAYGKLKLEAACEKTGDVYARFNVRVKEVYSSMELIFSALKSLPEGSIVSPEEIKLPANSMAVGAVEGWRGEILYFVMTDSKGEITRVDVRDPSFPNWMVAGHAGKGNVVPDFPLINKSFNLSYSGNDL